MAKQIWKDDHAMLNEELKNAGKIIDDYFTEEEKKFDREFAEELLKKRNKVADVKKDNNI